MKNKTTIKKEVGITLIALVITVIVLLILAGVTIGLLTGENGILNTAKNAADKYNNAAIDEQNQIDNILNLIGTENENVPNTKVIFNDPVLESAVKATLGIPEDQDVTERNILGLESFYLGYMIDIIKDLKGLEYAKNLKSINLAGGTKSNVSALNNLTKLETITINGDIELDLSEINNSSIKFFYAYQNNIDIDFNNFVGMSGLESINIYGGTPIDIQALKSLSNLKVLKLTGLYNSNITNIAQLTNLKELNIDGNYSNLTNISGLSTLVNLEHLSVQYNDITDISVINSMPKLKILYLGSGNVTTNITNINILTNKTQLEDIGIYDYISDLSILSGIINLKKIEIGYSGIESTDLGLINNHTNLETLIINNNKVSNVENITALQKLKNLYMWNVGNIGNINFISSLNNLENFAINSFVKYDLMPIKNKIKLKSLNFGEAENYEEVLPTLVNLENININNNTITNVNFIAGLSKLNSVSINGSNVTDLTALKNLNDLRYIWLNYTPNLDKIELYENSILHQISIGENKLTSLDFLKNAKKLGTIQIDNNTTITDVSVFSNYKNNFRMMHWGYFVNNTGFNAEDLRSVFPKYIDFKTSY